MTVSVFDSTGIVLLSSEYQLPMLFVVKVSLSKVTPSIFFNPLNASVALIQTPVNWGKRGKCEKRYMRETLTFNGLI